MSADGFSYQQHVQYEMGSRIGEREYVKNISRNIYFIPSKIFVEWYV